MNQEDDKPTVVLDIDALKAELAAKKNVSEAIDQDIEFSIHADETSPGYANPNSEIQTKVDKTKEIVFFDYSSGYFSKLLPKLPKSNDKINEKINYKFTLISTLPELNKILQSQAECIIIFHYNAAPKAVNQLTTQVKSKFKKAKTIIVAKGLSQEKANAHKASKAGADNYLSVPFSVKQFKKAIDSIS